ncbi:MULTISPECIES: hypothetical protein [Halorussus]|uniref:hypothetical protein n=1 Tax=Halorussus TaxID=1070314 RepID=UPI000E215118|nr:MULTISPECIES: hypothetical protein [Halorussus]NHN58741.1 hypothetical protein [Halorussus sp. JP-T4]
MVEVGEHYRPADRIRDAEGVPLTPGVYRVVGATRGVVLLRVTDEDGRRAHTGELRHVAPETLDSEFEPADDPDAGLSPVRDARNLLSGMYWNVRRFF